jgi:hypothetical protein
VSYAWIFSPYRYRGTAYVFQIFSRTTGDIPDLACSPGPRMENSKEEDRLFICRIRKTLQKYNLPSPEEILENPPKKQQWKNAMKKAINSFWYAWWYCSI